MTIALVSLLLGIGGGFYAAMNTMTPAVDFHVHDHVSKFGQLAEDAHATGDNAVAMWVLENHISLLEEHQQAGVDREWVTESDLNYSLVIQHARMAELQREINPDGFDTSIRLALAKASAVFEKRMTEDELMELLRKRNLL